MKLKLALLFFCIVSTALIGSEKNYSQFLENSRAAAIYDLLWEEVALPSEQDFIVVEGEWKIQPGTWKAVAGKRNRAILIAQWNHSSVRIELEAHMQTSVENARIGDITILVGASPDTQYFRSGYALTTGSFWNQCTTFYRHGKMLARTEYSPVLHDQVNHVVLEMHAGHIRYWLNGEIILEAHDSAPLTFDNPGYIGIRTWDTDMTIRNFRISQPSHLDQLKK